MGQDCKYCGAYIAGRADKCPACGKRISYKNEAKASYSSGNAQAYAYAEPEREKKQEPKSERSETYSYTYNNEAKQDERTSYTTVGQTSRTGSSSSDADAKENQLISFLCYFGILFLVPYLLRPNSDFVKFHSNQGLVLLVTGVVINVISDFVPLVGWLVGLVGGLFVFACFLKGVINVYRLEKKELPFIGSFKLLK